MKATTEQRERCMKNFGHTHTVLASGVQCDECGKPAVSGPVNGDSCHFFCRDHYLGHLAELRLTRPSMSERMRQIDAALAT